MGKGAAKKCSGEVVLGGAGDKRFHGDIAQPQIIPGAPKDNAGWFKAVKEQGKEMLPDPGT